MKRNQRSVLMVLLMSTVAMAGCKKGWEENPSNDAIQIQKEKEPIEYTMDVVRRGDVTDSVTIFCNYLQMEDEDLSFDVDGGMVGQVYVERGDSVKKGELLMELKSDQIEETTDSLEYDLSYQKLLLAQTKEQMEFDLNARTEQYHLLVQDMEDKEQKRQEKKTLEDDLEKIKKSYRTSIEDYEDSIAVKENKLEVYQKKRDESKLYAGMDGTVSYVKENLQNGLTKAGEMVIKIIDSSVCSFTSQEIKYKDYFKEGEPVMITMGFGAKAVQKEAYPMNPDEWKDEMFFELAEADYDLPIGTKGSIELALNTASDVLYINKSALHKAGEDSYVYLVDPQGMRSIQYVTTGQDGNGKIEIKSGLNEGDYIVLK